MFCCIFEINLVGSDTETPDYDQVLGLAEDLLTELGL